ncbi:TetR/AcrR family transcriptional regulator [Frondihabitans cladoniiphilus]|uniref:TetR/AcrR family transcriptional regulator n=1 Tax=Frondihabitans cladoniiphilus TaxID=715785 RepID=A0ABP8VPL0_9MICO
MATVDSAVSASAVDASGAGVAARPLRADARRNRDAILAAAHATFEVEGVLASLDGIAVKAGVGNATLYRNFPTRDDLLAAVIQDSIVAMLVEGDELSRTLSPAEALSEWCVRVAWQLRIWHDLPGCVVSALADEASPMNTACVPLQARTSMMLDAARAAGSVTSDVTADEIYELITTLSWGLDRFAVDAPAARRRVLLATAGLFAR